MPDEVKFTLLGVEELTNKFKMVSYDTKRKGGRAALRKAAKFLAAKAKANAESLDDPATTRSIIDNINLRWNGKLFKRKGDLGFRVGVLHGALLKKGGDLSENAPTPHWRLLEFGTKNMPAQPFMRRALSQNIGAITSLFIKEFNKSMDRAIKKAAKVKAGK